MKVIRPLILVFVLSSAMFGGDLPLAICPESAESPNLDGKLDDNCWKNATYITDLLDSRGNAFEKQRNEVFLCSDKKNLYIGVKCHDTDIDRIKKGMRTFDGNVFWDDCVEIFLSPGENHKEYFQFLVNAVGTRQDLYYNEFSDATWNGQWQAASHIGQDFWSVEIAIPYTDLGVTPKDGELWRLNIGREVRHDDEHVEILAWSPTYSDRLGDPEYFGQLRFSGTPSPRLTLRSHDFSGDKVRATLDATTKADFTIDVIASANEDRAVASQKLDVSQLGKPLELDVKYSPSWNDFSLCLAVKDTASGKLLYQSPQYPLAPQPLAPRLSQARVELSRMRADMALLKCGAMDKQYVVIPHPAFKTILPDELPDLGLFGKPVSITSCQDEYQPATFRVFSVKDLEQVRVELKGDLTSGDKALAKENIDLRVVKVWYQGGAGQKFSNTTLAPELLLKDDNLVDIDGKSGRNVLRFNGLPADGPDFKPFDIPAYTGKQVWLTAHIPPDTEPGTYIGTVEIKPGNAPATALALEVKVVPVTLRAPDKILGIYFHECYSYAATDSDMLKILSDMKAHGLNSLSDCGYDTKLKQLAPGKYEMDLSKLSHAMDMREKAGLNKALLLGFSEAGAFPRALYRVREKVMPDDTAKMKFIIEQIETAVKRGNSPSMYYFGIDEPGYDFSGKTLARCKELFEAMRQGGGKSVTAINLWGLGKLGDAIDLAILDNMDGASLYDNPGSKVDRSKCLVYWHPLENPSYDRLHYGVLLWKSQLAGAFPYAYRHVFQGSPYQDESEGPVPHRGTERNEMYTYPGLNGPIPTIQWEGVREGIDDLRYLQTLKYWVDIADNTQNAGAELKKTAAEARRLLALPPLFQRKFQELERNVQAKDFENLRAEILDKIIAIKRQVEKK